MPSRRRGLGSLNVTQPLRKALFRLQAERDRIDRQITGIERALAVLSGAPSAQERASATRRGGRQPMSAKARKALSRRMKAYWAKRRGTPAKQKPKGGARQKATAP
jgi:hypothetical protein